MLALLNSVRGADNGLSPEERQRGHRARTLIAQPKGNGASVRQAEAQAGVRLLREHPRLGGIRVLERESPGDVLETMKQLADSGLYEFVEPDYIRQASALPNDPSFSASQWSLQNTGQGGGAPGADIKASAAWDLQREASSVVVAVIDSGLRTTHEDIRENLWVNRTEANANARIDDDGNGYIDDINGIDATVPSSSQVAGNPNDVDGHGSHVAGIIGAVGNNGIGIAGVAWKVQLMPLKFIGRNGGTVSGAIACIDYAISRGASIINASYGSRSYSQGEYNAIKRARDAGIIFVAAAGNDSQEITAYPEYPAAYVLDNIVAVASTTRLDRLANYSTYGSGLVDLAAPGSSILSLGITSNSAYATLSGTSMAAPHVSGVLALLKQRYPMENYRALINRLLSSVYLLPAMENRVHSNGRLNLLRALASSQDRPFNDDFAGRAVITGVANVVRGSVQHATLESGEPAPANVAGTTGTLWWTWTAPATVGKLQLSTRGSEFDSVLGVYTGNSLATLVPVTSNDDATTELKTSSLTMDVVPGTTYVIAVAAKPGGQGLLALSLSTVPRNDAFANAQMLQGPSVIITGSNQGATLETGEPRPRNARGQTIGRGNTVWYKWTAPTTHRYQVSVTDETIDPVVSIYTGSALTNLAEIITNDDGELFRYDSYAPFNGIAGVTYYFAVDTAIGGGGRFNLSVSDAEWQTFLYDSVYNSPAVAPNGNVYVADGIGSITAVKRDGEIEWETETIYFDFIEGGAIAVGADGTFHLGTFFGDVYALGANGTVKWTYATTSNIWSAPAIGSDGTLYIKSDNGQLNAFTPQGTLRWQFAVQGDTYTSPVIGTDGTIYIASGDAALYAVNPDGTQKWRADLGATVYGSPAIGPDGTLYVGNYDGRFFAIRPDGTRRWQYDTGSPLSGSAVIDQRGVVYFGSYDKKLYALDAATGTKRWDYATGDIIRNSTPLIADDGVIYIGSDDGFVHAVNPDGTLRRTYATGGPILASPLLAAGRLYVASTDAKLYAFDVGTNLAASAWPMHRQNVRRTGRAGEVLTGFPTISAQPAATTANVGTRVTFSVGAALSGPGAASYQWRYNGNAIAGATNATLEIPSAQMSDVGSYSVIVTGPGGATISRGANLTVNATATANSRLVNLAVRTTAGAGEHVLFVGLVVGGDGTSGLKPLLLRAVGPTLTTSFGVPGTLADPALQLYASGGSTPIAGNDDWSGDTAVATLTPQVGAFALAATNTKDAALISNRPGGGYTVQISSSTTERGTILAEIYDATPSASFGAATPRLVNVSARTHVGTGDDVLIAGFAIAGTTPKKVMLRGVGPGLIPFGVMGALTNPKLELFAAGSSTAISGNDDWGAAANAAEVAATASKVGAFALALESKDSVLLVTLPPGSYTAQVSGVNGTTGAAIVEVYEVP